MAMVGFGVRNQAVGSPSVFTMQCSHTQGTKTGFGMFLETSPQVMLNEEVGYAAVCVVR